MRYNSYLLFVIFSLLMLATSCSKDDDSDSSNNNGGGGTEDTADSFITMSIEGDETAEFSSDAHASLPPSDNGYELIIQRGPDDAGENTSFIVSFLQETSEVTLPIPTGSFDMVSHTDQEQDDGKFSVVFTNFETGTNFGYEVDGTFNITESNEDYLEGDFSFTTTSFTSGEEEVQVTGAFLAPTTW